MRVGKLGERGDKARREPDEFARVLQDENPARRALLNERAHLPRVHHLRRIRVRGRVGPLDNEDFGRREDLPRHAFWQADAQRERLGPREHLRGLRRLLLRVHAAKFLLNARRCWKGKRRFRSAFHSCCLARRIR